MLTNIPLILFLSFSSYLRISFLVHLRITFSFHLRISFYFHLRISFSSSDAFVSFRCNVLVEWLYQLTSLQLGMKVRYQMVK